MRHYIFLIILALLCTRGVARAGQQPDQRFPLFEYLTGQPTPTLITYTPSELDPRNPVNQQKLKTSSIRADLEKLRPHFDGLVLYGYNEACTPRILGVAKELKFKAVLLAIWDPKSAAEVDGVATLARQYEKDFALAILVGNEGIIFKRYEPEDVTLAAARLKGQIPKSVPVSTSEPLVGYEAKLVRDFGDFLAPNIHPVFDRPKLGPVGAAAWAREEAAKLAKQTGKPVLLKETGFPHDGKPGYTHATQKEFWAAYLKPGIVAHPTGAKDVWAYYGIAFDAFDLPWKAQASGLPIEKSWGLFSDKRQPFPALGAWPKASSATSLAAPRNSKRAMQLPEPKVMVTIAKATGKRNADGIFFTVEVTLTNNTGKQLNVKSTFASAFDGLSLVMFNDGGTKLAEQAYIAHQSPFAPPGRDFPLEVGKNTKTLVFPIRGMPKNLQTAQLLVVGELPGAQFEGKQTLCSNLLKLMMQE